MNNPHKPITEHSGSKYIREIYNCVDGTKSLVDVYAVIEAFKVTCPARQHAIKKLLCAGIRGKGGEVEDLQESIDSMFRAVEMQVERERREKEKEVEKYIEKEEERVKEEIKQYVCSKCLKDEHALCTGKSINSSISCSCNICKNIETVKEKGWEGLKKIKEKKEKEREDANP